MIENSQSQSLSLVVRRTIRATPERLFEAWTTPEQLETWWGPAGVTCPIVEIDLRPQGRYKIANQTPDGSILWIVGEFERITPPRELVYTWRLEPGPERYERVTVTFAPQGDQTEVVVVHDRIDSELARGQHEHGWLGCLDGLVDFVGS